MQIAFNKFNDFYLKNKENILSNLDKVLISGEYIRSKEIEALEKRISKICNRKYAITTSSCTDALFLSLKSCGVNAGDEVILPSFSYIASLSPILMCNAKPVFVDIEPGSLTLDFNSIKSALTSKTKAVIFAQLFGASQDLSDLILFLKDKNIVLIEDAAQALGSKVNKFNGGEQGDLSCISFDPTKIVSAFGTGGIILTDNQKYYNRLTKLIHHGRNNNGEFEVLGYNSKISELNAAIINLQLIDLNPILKRNNIIANQYFEELKNIKNIKVLKPKNNSYSSFHKFILLAENRDELRKHLHKHGVETKIHYPVLLHEHKLIKNLSSIKHETPISDYIKTQVLSLPIYPSLKHKEISYICQMINNFYAK